MPVKIVVPSRKRSETMKTNIENMILLVAKSEVEEYRRHNCEIMTHDDLDSLAKIRQFAYKNLGELFFVDDDIVSVEKTYLTKGSHLSPAEICELIQETAYAAKSIGAKLYGFNNDPSPTHYNQHKPFQLNGYINGCAFGLFADENLYFSEKTTACESHWINLLNAHYNRFCFIDKRFHFRQMPNSTFTLPGGQTGRRTMESEKADTLFLKRTFGNSVEIKKEQNKTKRLHEFQRVLNIKL